MVADDDIDLPSSWGREVSRACSTLKWGQPGALIGPPSRMELDLASRQPVEIMQARDGLAGGAPLKPPA